MNLNLNGDFLRATKLVIVVERVRFFEENDINKWDGQGINVSSFQVEGMSTEDFIAKIQALIDSDVASAQQNPVELSPSQELGALEYYIRAEDKEFPFLRVELLNSEGHLRDKEVRGRQVANAITSGKMEAEFEDIDLTLANFIRLPILEPLN